MQNIKNVSEICLKIDDIVKAQNIPFETYKQVNSLLCEIITTHNEKVGNVDNILKEVYLDIANTYDVSDLESKSDIVACVASAFREKVHNKIN